MASDYWACARLCAGHERLAVHCLTKVSRYEIYQPRTVERRVVRGRKVNVTAALFPGYLFIWIVGGQWSRAAYTPGVANLLRNGSGDAPAVVSDAIISELRSRERGGFIRLPKAPGLRRGDRVLITQGPFADKFAIYQSQSGAQRVAVLLALLGGRVACLRQRMPLVSQPQLAESRRPTNDALCQHPTLERQVWQSSSRV
ncbi:MAG: transcription termination/antitermination NusG family protein [Rhodoplanes sp.]